MTKQRAKIGDTRWEVRWISRLAFYPEDHQTVDRDACVYSCRYVATRDQAMAAARAVYPATEATVSGVQVTPQQFVPYDHDDAARYPHAGYWEDTTEGEWYEGPE